MNVYLHDLRHVLRSPVLIALAVLVALSSAMVYSTVTGQAGTVTVSGSGFYYYETSAFHISLWTYDIAGNPVTGVSVELNATPIYFNVSQGTHVPSYYVNASGDSSGRLQFVYSIPDGSYFVQSTVTAAHLPLASLQLGGSLPGFTLENVSAGAVAGLTPLMPVAGNYYSQVARFLAFWSGPSGSPPSGAEMRYCTSPAGLGLLGPSNCSGLASHSMGALSGFRNPYPQPQAPPASWVVVELVNSSGGVVDTVIYGGGWSTGSAQPVPTLTVTPPGTTILSAFGSLLSFFLPLMGFVAAYWTYARPRLSGTLEPVLVRPVTRRGLLLERYAGVVLMLSAAIVAEVLILDLMVTTVLGQPLPVSYVAPIIGSLLVAALGFAGLIFLLAHAARSTALVVALGSVLFIVLAPLFWATVLALIGFYLGGIASTTDFTVLVLRLHLLSPLWFPSLTLDFVNGSGTAGGPGSTYALAGISAGLLAALGALWVVLPILGTVWRAGRRD